MRRSGAAAASVKSAASPTLRILPHKRRAIANGAHACMCADFPAFRILPCAAGEGDHAKRGGGGSRRRAHAARAEGGMQREERAKSVELAAGVLIVARRHQFIVDLE